MPVNDFVSRMFRYDRTRETSGMFAPSKIFSTTQKTVVVVVLVTGTVLEADEELLDEVVTAAVVVVLVVVGIVVVVLAAEVVVVDGAVVLPPPPPLWTEVVVVVGACKVVTLKVPVMPPIVRTALTLVAYSLAEVRLIDTICPLFTHPEAFV